MQKLIVITALAVLVPMLAAAQDSERPLGQGYIFVGTGTHKMGLTVGLGGEGYIYKGLGLGAEVEATGIRSYLPYQPNTIGVGSADVSYHLFPKKIRRNAAPFVAGGYTLFFGHDTPTGIGFGNAKPLATQGYNVGAGIAVFANEQVGVRFDVRYNGHGGLILQQLFPNVRQFSFTAFRIGVTFRALAEP